MQARPVFPGCFREALSGPGARDGRPAADAGQHLWCSLSAALKSGSHCRALVLTCPTVTPWHTHTHAWPHSTQSSASPAVCGLTCVPTGRAALFLPRTQGAPPARSAPSTTVPLWTRAARVLWNPGHSLAHTQPAGLSRLQEPSETARTSEERAIAPTCTAHMPAVRAGDRSNSTPGLVLLGAQPGRG